MNRMYEDAYELIESMAMTSFQCPTKLHTYSQRPSTKPQDRANPSDHTIGGQRLDRIKGEVQSLRMDVKQVQSKCTNSTRTLTKLQDQIRQLMSMMGDIKRQITENNPRRGGKEHVKAITLWSGKVLSSQEHPTQEVDIQNTDDLQERSLEAEDEMKLEEVIAPIVEPGKETTKDSTIANIPFPSRLEEKQKREEDEFNLFKLLNVNLALIELNDKVPKYANFLKEIISSHRKIKVGEQVNISSSYSAIISRQIPKKLKDLRSFTIPIEIGSIHFNRAL
ncbi:acidic leucine-rich nuclear phosphoprotein 32 family member B-like [Gossypium australe]|uniref:Acidic leucine-rich nuclear phosphoprotein 32 family member B-like n=1 Tax=Gossypium australe TaxID=47621 RepID=A0A5B6VP61_9ROSI|nr:acidic leucine-rich nuclear phosphoprotein 32 family member B-like [Gossypium australe]